MIVFPAIDLSNGKIVRLHKGRFENKIIYNTSLEKQVEIYEKNDAKWIHVIDLDGALSGKTQNSLAIKRIIRHSKCKIQLGGGIRSLFKIEEWINLGIDRVIIGTQALRDDKFVENAVKEFPNTIAVGLDLVGEYVAVDGWTKLIKKKKADYYFKKFSGLGVECIIYTDINKDGVLKGPNIENTLFYKKMVEVPLIASGGVSCLQDLINLRDRKVYGVIVGKAIYENKIRVDKLFKIK